KSPAACGAFSSPGAMTPKAQIHAGFVTLPILPYWRRLWRKVRAKVTPVRSQEEDVTRCGPLMKKLAAFPRRAAAAAARCRADLTGPPHEVELQPLPDQLGSSTLSITWITPFDWNTFWIVTLEA